jgi:hypothetical protein
MKSVSDRKIKPDRGFAREDYFVSFTGFFESFFDVCW